MKGLEEKVTFNLCDSILVRILGEAHSECLIKGSETQGGLGELKASKIYMYDDYRS